MDFLDAGVTCAGRGRQTSGWVMDWVKGVSRQATGSLECSG